jgi:hypothetical protein
MFQQLCGVVVFNLLDGSVVANLSLGVLPISCIVFLYLKTRFYINMSKANTTTPWVTKIMYC